MRGMRTIIRTISNLDRRLQDYARPVYAFLRENGLYCAIIAISTVLFIATYIFAQMERAGLEQEERARKAFLATIDAGHLPHPESTDLPRWYPYAVVMLGVHNLNEFVGARATDPLVARHYAGIYQGSLQPAVWTDSKPVYVSFRNGGEIYYTKTKRHVPAGAPVLVVSPTIAIRQRCGNLLAFSLPPGARFLLPPDDERIQADMDLADAMHWRLELPSDEKTPFVPPVSIPPSTVLTPKLPPTVVSIPPAVVPQRYGPAFFGFPYFAAAAVTVPVTVAPEPGTICSVGGAVLLGLLLVCFTGVNR
jgi:hypothetical protein